MTETAAPRKFQRKKAITVPTLKFVVDKPLYVKILNALHEGKTRVGRGGKVAVDGDGNPRKPPTLMNCINLESGEECQVIAAEVIKSELSESFPNDGYVGKCFEITKQKRKEGKQYDPYEIFEIADPTPAADESSATPTKAAGAKK